MDVHRRPEWLNRRRIAASVAAALLVAGLAVTQVFASSLAQAAGTQRLEDETVLAPPQAADTLKDPVAAQADFVSVLAGKLGVSTDKLQSAMAATAHELGLPGLLQPPPAPPTASADLAVPYQATLTTVLGIDARTLAQEWTDRSLADVARAHNVAVDTVAAALKNARAAELDKAIRDGVISGSLAQTMRAHVDTDVDLLMNLPRPAMPGVRSTQ
jgi:hypothetical protein